MAHHVFVETNWIVDYAAPILTSDRSASELLMRARSGEIRLHVPAVALVEARKVIRQRSPRDDLDAIRTFLRSARAEGNIAAEDIDTTLTSLSRFEAFADLEKKAAPTRIGALLDEPGVSVFPLDEAILERSVRLAVETVLELQSFDMAILSAVLVRGSLLHATGDEVSFCTLDAHLHPWDRKGARKNSLAELYEASGVRVVGDFLLEPPRRPGG